MKRIVSSKEMKALDTYTMDVFGLPSLVLMERASLSVAGETEKRISADDEILVVCGSGNNGGDGIAIARLLYLKGYKAVIFMAGNPDKMTDSCRTQYDIAINYGVPVIDDWQAGDYDVIIDALFGVGLDRPVKGSYAEILSRMNEGRALRIAVDIPSGISGDTGEILGTAFYADLTITFAYKKKGMCLFPGMSLCGEVITADIGIYDKKISDKKAEESSSDIFDIEKKDTYLLDSDDLSLLPERVPWGNKGTFGKVLVVAGSEGMCGAAYFAAAGALRAGAGMVKIQTVAANLIPLQSMLPEAMVETDDSEAAFLKSYVWCDCLIIGPGLGMEGPAARRAEWFLSKAHEDNKPVILDADGLNLLASMPSWMEYLGDNVILTPHPGEMGRLTGMSIAEVEKAFENTASAYARFSRANVCLKSSATIVASSAGEVYYVEGAVPGLSTAGSGDVLAGIIAGVICRFLFTDKAGITDYSMALKAGLGVLVHKKAGEEMGPGCVARDIINSVAKKSAGGGPVKI